MQKINLNKLAKAIALKEGKKINLSIAQVKEVLSITLKELAKFNCIQVLILLKRYKR
ncbi:MAG: hypothetical protein KJ864_02340 [Candidatus Omnitrophica bacterium]|nr:hypothetical protein [Candidatus Omnitrophota bacterium]MBU1895091.1 hypothetical protein [Candidatus Omnitrophota bacterium]